MWSCTATATISSQNNAHNGYNARMGSDCKGASSSGYQMWQAGNGVRPQRQVSSEAATQLRV